MPMMSEILSLGVALSMVHVLMPKYWVPIAVIAKSEGWGRFRLRQVAALTGLSQSLGTMIIGVGVDLLGMKGRLGARRSCLATKMTE